MCCTKDSNGHLRKYLTWPVLAVCISITLEICLVSLHVYSYHQTLVDVTVDEIFFVISAVFLLLSIFWLFASSWHFMYEHFRIIRGFQAVVMITNGSMLILSAVRTKNSKECQLLEDLHQGFECQKFETRIFIGSLALVDGLLYFFRRPISLTKEERFCPQSRKNHMDHQKKAIGRKCKKGKGCILEEDQHWTEIKTDVPNPMIITVENDFDCILKVDVSERRQSQQSQQGSYLTDTGHCMDSEENHVDNLAEINKKVSTSPNSFYYNYNQEYFLPNVEVLSPKNSRHHNEDRYSTLTRDIHNSDRFN